MLELRGFYKFEWLLPCFVYLGFDFNFELLVWGLVPYADGLGCCVCLTLLYCWIFSI